MDCKKIHALMPELLLGRSHLPADAEAHLRRCGKCSAELNELRATMELMGEWEAPEPNAFFDAKLRARLRAEREAAPAGLLERLRDRFRYGSGVRMQPLMAGALATILVVGGGTYAELSWQHSQVQESATVLDLQSLDRNAEVLQQLDSVDQAQPQNPDSNGPSSDL